MTSYQGGKKQLGKHIYNIILDLEEDLEDMGYIDGPLPYFEPFCGMCGVLIHFAKDSYDKTIERDIVATDINKDIIAMWKELQNGWIPPSSCSKTRYEELRDSKKHSAERGFIGITCSFGGQFFSGGFRTKSSVHNFVEAGKRGLLKYIEYMPKKIVKFMKPSSYDEFEPKGMLIYCDPPYKDNKLSTETFQNFDHDKFWNVMRKWSKNNIVVISELEAPSDFYPIWSKKYNMSFLNRKSNTNTKKSFDEQLFIHKNIYNKLN